MKFLISFITFYSFVSIFWGFSNTPQTSFEEANAFYAKGQYHKAIEQYESILANGDESEAIYYNLGNAYYKANEIGKAVLNFERALLLNPSDEDAAYNLKIINENLPDQLDVISPFFLEEWWQQFHHSFSSNVWSWLMLLCLWLGIGGLIVWLMAASRTRKKQGFIGGILLLGISLLFFLAARSQSKIEQNSQQAIVLTPSIDLLNGPDEQSGTILTIHEGLKIELMDQIGKWRRVKLSNGEQGWLPTDALEEI